MVIKLQEYSNSGQLSLIATGSSLLRCSQMDRMRKERRRGGEHSILKRLEIIIKKSSHCGMQTPGQTYQLSKVCLSTLQLRNKNNKSSK